MLLPPHNPKGHKQMPPGERAKTLFRLFCFKEKKPLKYQRQKNIPSEG